MSDNNLNHILNNLLSDDRYYADFAPRLLQTTPELNNDIKNKTIIINNNTVKFNFYYVEGNLYAIKLINENNINIGEVKEYILNKYNIELLDDEIPYISTNIIEKVITIDDKQYNFDFLMFNDIILYISLSMFHYDIITNHNEINSLKSYIHDNYNMELYISE